MDEENLELTDFIKKSVQGIAPEEKIEVINGKKKKKKIQMNFLKILCIQLHSFHMSYHIVK